MLLVRRYPNSIEEHFAKPNHAQLVDRTTSGIFRHHGAVLHLMSRFALPAFDVSNHERREIGEERIHGRAVGGVGLHDGREIARGTKLINHAFLDIDERLARADRSSVRLIGEQGLLELVSLLLVEAEMSCDPLFGHLGSVEDAK